VSLYTGTSVVVNPNDVGSPASVKRPLTFRQHLNVMIAWRIRGKKLM